MEFNFLTHPEFELSKLINLKLKITLFFIVFFLIISTLFVFIIKMFNHGIFKPETTPRNINTTSSHLITNYPQSKSKNVGEFYIIFSANLLRDKSGYRLVEDLLPVLPTPNDQEKIKSFEKAVESQKEKTTIFRVDFVNNQGNKQSYFTNLNYCPPHDDVCLTLNKELEIGQAGFLNPLTLKITPQIQFINVYVNNKLIKSLTRVPPGPKILSFTKKPQGNNYILQWVVDQEKSWIALNYLISDTQWSTNLFGKYNDFKEHSVNPKNIQSTLDKIDFRLLATDGFNLNVWEEKEFIIAPKNKDIFIDLRGLDEEQWVGQNANIDVDFFDPETGTGCGSEGCTHGLNQGKYIVTWFSDKQNICLTDIYNGTLQYIFKKEGLQTIGARVQHKEKPELKAEISKQVLVHPPNVPFEDKNLNCSF